ncbi:MAG TPA: phosphoglucomutase (alpha-D-glucose-1,6-bisphosphate-dependent) [Deltaproteobacteria bacterium]|nr:phosphoglucomutase (alpha-D-glucose-1,6-bisphosphate-dependent) [Deltaproteobacteria bacterium]
MALNNLAGRPAPKEILIDVSALVDAYYSQRPDHENPAHRVSFGTSGHRGSSLKQSFNEDHILAISQAICMYRQKEGITGPLFMGMDTHALSGPAQKTAIEVFAANGVNVMIAQGGGYTPTPVISHAILTYNRERRSGQADGVVVTPSHNPPNDGGFKYNPPQGGPADTSVTDWIAKKANELLADSNSEVKRVPYEKAITSPFIHEYDYAGPYVEDLKNVIDMDVIGASGMRIGADALGGSGFAFWGRIAEHYGLNIEVINAVYDPTFSFMRVDHDGKIRMDCSSPYAMASLIDLKDQYDIAFGNDPDFDRHGIVTPSAGLMNPNHYLSVAIYYLFSHRSLWSGEASVGKTLVSSSMIDRIAMYLKRRLLEVPVGFKWFVDGLLDGSCAFGGEESAGASFLRNDGTVWTTDKDGIIMSLLAAEITAVTDMDPGVHYAELSDMFGSPFYERIDAPATVKQKSILKNLSPELVTRDTLADEKIVSRLNRAPGNSAPIGGLKVSSRNGWFAARPSGTEEVYKIYAESFLGVDHLRKIQEEAKDIVSEAFTLSGA